MAFSVQGKITGVVNSIVDSFRLLNRLALIPALVLLLLGDILLRSLLLAPIPWAQEVIGLLLLSIFLTGIPVLAAASDWLSVDFINGLKNRRLQRLISTLSIVSILLFALVFAAGGWYATRDIMEYQESTRILAVPYWPFTLLMCVSGLVTALVAALQFFQPSYAPDTGNGEHTQ